MLRRTAEWVLRELIATLVTGTFGVVGVVLGGWLGRAFGLSTTASLDTAVLAGLILAGMIASIGLGHALFARWLPMTAG